MGNINILIMTVHGLNVERSRELQGASWAANLRMVVVSTEFQSFLKVQCFKSEYANALW